MRVPPFSLCAAPRRAAVTRRGLALAMMLANVLSSIPAAGMLQARAPELQAEEQRVIGVSLPIDQAASFSPVEESHRKASLRSLRSNNRLLVIHLWATWCKPCEEEFVPLKKIFADGQYQGAQLILIAVQSPAGELRAFLQRHQSGLPPAPHYVDDTTALQSALKMQKLPLTLLVDRQWIVRQAFYGPITERQTELKESIRRYMAPKELDAIDRCDSPPCIQPSFFLHRSLFLTNTSRWSERRKMLVPGPVDLPVSALPNLIYLFTPGCSRCRDDLAELQKVAHGWSRVKDSRGAFVVVMVSADAKRAAEMLSRQPDFPNALIVHSSMPRLMELMAAAGDSVTLIMNRQGFVRNAFIGSFASRDYKVAATDALYMAAQGR